MIIRKYTDIVAGMWLLDSSEAAQIHGSLRDFCIIVMVSEMGYWYAEKMHGDRFTSEDRADLSYRVGRDWSLFLSLDQKLDGYWSVCKEALVNHSLGKPDFGYNSIKNGSTQDTQSGCVCDTITLWTTGCPSARGLKCPSRI